MFQQVNRKLELTNDRDKRFFGNRVDANSSLKEKKTKTSLKLYFYNGNVIKVDSMLNHCASFYESFFDKNVMALKFYAAF